jgi:hypothetical protein
MLIKKDSLPDRPIEGIESRVAYAVYLAREHKAIGFFSCRVVSLLDLPRQCDVAVFFQRRLSMFRVDGLSRALPLCPLQIMRHPSSGRGTGFPRGLQSSEA